MPPADRAARHRHARRLARAALCLAACAALPERAGAQEAPAASTAAAACAEKRPAAMFNRWQEDWSVLASPCVPRQPFDALKYIPFSGDPDTYLSLGANLRERVEVNNSPVFGLGAARANTYLLQRAEIHADARLGKYVQVFVQLEDARPFGKDMVSPADKNVADVEQAFIAVVHPLGEGVFKARVGRQQMAFDLQRFVSVRDGPNVRQAFDALWADWEIHRWRLIAYATQPVQYRDNQSFDDVSNRDLTFSGVRVERQNVGPGDLSAYYSRYNRRNARFLDGGGDEHRNVFDARYAGNANHIDWDVEGMVQTGHVGNRTINAWALGSLGGYTFATVPWKPRAGLQVDAASGDRHPGDGHIGTFNPLFPNGYYFTLAGYTGYSNLIHVKPSITVKPTSKLSVLAAAGFQWRATTGDAVYAQGNATVPGTAGRGSRWTGMYLQLRTEVTLAANLVGAVEAVHFQVGDSIRELGGRNADYVGVELKYGW